jgi:hypothetical protein
MDKFTPPGIYMPDACTLIGHIPFIDNNKNGKSFLPTTSVNPEYPPARTTYVVVQTYPPEPFPSAL